MKSNIGIVGLMQAAKSPTTVATILWYSLVSFSIFIISPLQKKYINPQRKRIYPLWVKTKVRAAI
jgi:hypothetical protein